MCMYARLCRRGRTLLRRGDAIARIIYSNRNGLLRGKKKIKQITNQVKAMRKCALVDVTHKRYFNTERVMCGRSSRRFSFVTSARCIPTAAPHPVMKCNVILTKHVYTPHTHCGVNSSVEFDRNVFNWSGSFDRGQHVSRSTIRCERTDRYVSA